MLVIRIDAASNAHRGRSCRFMAVPQAYSKAEIFDRCLIVIPSVSSGFKQAECCILWPDVNWQRQGIRPGRRLLKPLGKYLVAIAQPLEACRHPMGALHITFASWSPVGSDIQITHLLCPYGAIGVRTIIIPLIPLSAKRLRMAVTASSSAICHRIGFPLAARS